MWYRIRMTTVPEHHSASEVNHMCFVHNYYNGVL